MSKARKQWGGFVLSMALSATAPAELFAQGASTQEQPRGRCYWCMGGVQCSAGAGSGAVTCYMWGDETGLHCAISGNTCGLAFSPMSLDADGQVLAALVGRETPLSNCWLLANAVRPLRSNALGASELREIAI